MEPIIIVLTIAGVIVLLIFAAIVATFFRIWIRAFAAKTNVSFLRLVGMSLRKVNPSIMVDSRIMAVKAGLDVSWDVGPDSLDIHVGRIHLTVLNVPGSLGDLSTVIARNEGNISNLKITRRSPEFFDMLIDIEVRDVKHLTDVIAALRSDPAINSVDRARG